MNDFNGGTPDFEVMQIFLDAGRAANNGSAVTGWLNGYQYCLHISTTRTPEGFEGGRVLDLRIRTLENEDVIEWNDGALRESSDLDADKIKAGKALFERIVAVCN